MVLGCGMSGSTGLKVRRRTEPSVPVEEGREESFMPLPKVPLIF